MFVVFISDIQEIRDGPISDVFVKAFKHLVNVKVSDTDITTCTHTIGVNRPAIVWKIQHFAVFAAFL